MISIHRLVFTWLYSEACLKECCCSMLPWSILVSK